VRNCEDPVDELGQLIGGTIVNEISRRAQDSRLP